MFKDNVVIFICCWGLVCFVLLFCEALILVGN